MEVGIEEGSATPTGGASLDLASRGLSLASALAGSWMVLMLGWGAATGPAPLRLSGYEMGQLLSLLMPAVLAPMAAVIASSRWRVALLATTVLGDLGLAVLGPASGATPCVGAGILGMAAMATAIACTPRYHRMIASAGAMTGLLAVGLTASVFSAVDHPPDLSNLCQENYRTVNDWASRNGRPHYSGSVKGWATLNGRQYDFICAEGRQVSITPR